VKFLFRIFIAILSGLSTCFAFPTILVLVDRILSRTVFFIFPYVGILILFACVILPFPIYYALKYRDIKKIQTPKKTQAIIVFAAASLPIAIFIVFGGTSFKGTISLLLWNIALLLNLFFFSAIVLSSLYYLLRTALAVKRRQEAHCHYEQPKAKK